MKRHDKKEGQPERQRPGAEHLRNRQRHHEKPRHRGDQQPWACSTSCVTCVMTKTKTRSKKSSIEETPAGFS